MLFLFYALLYFALSITSAAAPTNDPSHHQFNPQAKEFRPAQPLVVDGSNPPLDPNMPEYMKADISKMKTAEEVGLQPGQLYNVRGYILVGHDSNLSNPRNLTVCYRV